MNRLTAGVIGGGAIAEVAHLPAYMNHRSINRIVLAEIRGDRRTDLSSQFDLAATYPTGSELLEQENPDIVSICTPPHTHEDIFLKSAHHASAIYCEKPLALSVTSAEKMAEVASENDITTQIGYTHPFIGNFDRVTQLVQNELLGRIQHVSTRRINNPPGASWHYDSPAGGVVSDLGPHELDFYIRLFNESPSIQSVNLRRLGTKDVEDYCVVNMEVAGADIRMLLSWGQPSSTRHPPPTHHKENIVGDAGWIECDSDILEGKIYGKSIKYRNGRLPIMDLFSRYTFWGDSPENIHQSRIAAFIDCVISDDSQTTAPIERGVEVTRLVQAIYEESTK
jgi:predicted dehydrogenase